LTLPKDLRELRLRNVNQLVEKIISQIPGSVTTLELSNIKCLTNDSFTMVLAPQLISAPRLIELSLKQTALDLNSGPVHDAFIEILRSNHKTLKVLDISGNLINDKCLEAISSLAGIEVTKTSYTALELKELVLLHLCQMDKHLDLIKTLPKLRRVSPVTSPLTIKLSHYQVC